MTNAEAYWHEKAEWWDYQLTVARERGDDHDVLTQLEVGAEDARRYAQEALSGSQPPRLVDQIASELVNALDR